MGRLPPASSFGCPSSRPKPRMRLLNTTPVLAESTPLPQAENTDWMSETAFPSASIATSAVVSPSPPPPATACVRTPPARSSAAASKPVTRGSPASASTAAKASRSASTCEATPRSERASRFSASIVTSPRDGGGCVCTRTPPKSTASGVPHSAGARQSLGVNAAPSPFSVARHSFATSPS